MEPGFIKAQSDNLPKVDSMMLASYLSANRDFVAAEMRGVKAERSGRESYGDKAIGYVQLKRSHDSPICTVKARITPEHKVRNKPYSVKVIVNESEEEIIEALCEDCVAAPGGCKHIIAFISWLHRRSEEPSTTELKCYWRKSTLSKIGTELKFVKARDMGPSVASLLLPEDDNFINTCMANRSEAKRQTNFFNFFTDRSEVEKLSIHYLIEKFKSSDIANNFNNFVLFCKSSIIPEICNEAFNMTKDQADCPLWFELRYGRITASKAHETARCKKVDGVLVDVVLGATKIRDSAAMARGRALEPLVIKEVERKKKIKINKCGLIIKNKYPLLGVSPDGICKEYVIEVKCPSKESTMKNYFNQDGKINSKYFAQIQLQMYYCNKQEGLFCVAAHNFTDTKNVKIFKVPFDEEYCDNLIADCIQFWESAIFPLLIKD